MNTIVAILEADADGTLHLPLPAELRDGKVEVTATLRAAVTPRITSELQLRDKMKRRQTALQELRKLGGLTDIISDPEEWQREIRKDRSVVGRD